MTAKLNDVDPQAWLADVLARINDQGPSLEFRLWGVLPAIAFGPFHRIYTGRFPPFLLVSTAVKIAVVAISCRTLARDLHAD